MAKDMAKNYKHIEVSPMTPSIGAILSGVDLSKPLSDTVFGEIETALLHHKVIFFRDQELTPDSHMAFASKFGTCEPAHPIIPHLKENSQITLLENDADRPPEINYWHTDVTWRKNPPMGSILYGVAIPEKGGDTIWADMAAVYESLSDKMKTFLCSLEAEHSIAAFQSSQYDGAQSEKMSNINKSFPPVTHPVIRTHPITGQRGVFVNSIFTSRIKNVPRDESEAILKLLYAKTETPEFQVRFRWEKGSLAVWDNRCTQHYAVADYYPDYRRMHRITIVGDTPYLAASNGA